MTANLKEGDAIQIAPHITLKPTTVVLASEVIIEEDPTDYQNEAARASRKAKRRDRDLDAAEAGISLRPRDWLLLAAREILGELAHYLHRALPI